MKKQKLQRADKGVVLFHPDVGETILLYFDVFVNNMYIKKQIVQLKDSLYNAEDCLFVNKWQRVHKNYTYLGSEDLKHIPSVQLKIFEMLVDLQKLGFTFETAWRRRGLNSNKEMKKQKLYVSKDKIHRRIKKLEKSMESGDFFNEEERLFNLIGSSVDVGSLTQLEIIILKEMLK